MWPYTDAEQHWLGGGSSIAWTPDTRQSPTQNDTERPIARDTRPEASDDVPELVARYRLEHVYSLAERMADVIVRLVAMIGR